MSAAVSGAKRGLENCSNVFNRRNAKNVLTAYKLETNVKTSAIEFIWMAERKLLISVCKNLLKRYILLFFLSPPPVAQMLPK